MSDNCPICETLLTEKRLSGYDCPRCGKFVIEDYTIDVITPMLNSESGKSKEEKVAILSHAIRKMQKGDYSWPTLDRKLVRAILKNSLPSLNEQANNLIIWFAENVSPGEKILVEPSTHQSIAGAKDPGGFALILKYFLNQGLIEGKLAEVTGAPGRAYAMLSFDGWEYYHRLKKSGVASRKAFMAMQYGDEELDEIVDKHFKPAVACTGFDLYKLAEKPRAGLIDDNLRVEIRSSRFLISDLTHANAGAYWEAGYAEGLGKPVIYTCKKEVFEDENKRPHFDTNHHLTVIWDGSNIEEAIKDLKATIRATLPDEAKLTDD